MELSLRLKMVASLVEKCETMADIGTDHAYIPIYLVKEGVCNKAIASDINKGPVEKAKINVALEGLQNKIECRLGGGLSTIEPGEVDCAVIAGMGGNLIRDIIEERKDVFKSLEYLILQPVQNPEILREYIIQSGYQILDEELCIDENKFYEIIKIKYDHKPMLVDPIFYEIGNKLIDKEHPLVREYINYKLEKYYKILNLISENTLNSQQRKFEVSVKIQKLKELLLLCH
jgi:tRNA (adenine22-N1)-methyltransferase